MGGVGGISGVGGGGDSWPSIEPVVKELGEAGKIFQEAVKYHNETGKWNIYQLADLQNRLEAIKDDRRLTEFQKAELNSALNILDNLMETNKQAYDIQKQMNELIKQGKEDSHEFGELQNLLIVIESELMDIQANLQVTMAQLCGFEKLT